MPRKNTPKFFQSRPECQGKKRYNSEDEAKTIADQQEIINFADELKLEVYRCHLCGGWHLTRKRSGV